MCSYPLWKTKEKYSSCQGLLLGCIFLLPRSPESCVTVLVDIQMQTLKHSARERKGNNWIANVPDNSVDLFCFLLQTEEENITNMCKRNDAKMNAPSIKSCCLWKIKSNSTIFVVHVDIKCVPDQISSVVNSYTSFFGIFFFSSSADMTGTPADWTGVTILQKEESRLLPARSLWGSQTPRVTEVLIKTRRVNVKTVRKKKTKQEKNACFPSSSAWLGRRLSRDGRFMLIVTAFHFGKTRQNPQRRLICKFSSVYVQSVPLFSRVKFCLSPPFFTLCFHRQSKDNVDLLW